MDDGLRMGGLERPGTKRKVMDSVLAGLVDRIVSGDLPEGTTLPTETELQEAYGVSRTTLREAMQYVAAQGMVRSRTRAGTLVMPHSQWNYLDPLVLEAAMRHARDDRFYLALLEARRMLEPAAAEMAASRASAAQLADIARAFERMVASQGRDTEAWSLADLEFHAAIIDACGNWVFRQFAIAIRAGLLASLQMTNRYSQTFDHAIGLHGKVLEAIRMRQPAKARAAMEVLIGTAHSDLLEAMRLRGGTSRPSP